MKNIVLIGMMGCGKSTCGKELSQRLNRKFIDTDSIIVERENRPITDIFALNGEEYFRDLESSLCRELCCQEDLIIATGGGLPLREENAALLRESGIVIWLKRDPASTFSSETMDGRPLAQNGMADFIKRFYDRSPKYYAASHAVIEDFSDVNTTTDLILDAVTDINNIKKTD